MNMTEIIAGQTYAVSARALRREARKAWKAGGGWHDLASVPYSPAYPGVVLETGVPCPTRPDGVRVEARKHDDRKIIILTVHAREVLKRWDEHELSEDISARESILRLADTLERRAREIRDEWGW
jgi:hypothetical protein